MYNSKSYSAHNMPTQSHTTPIALTQPHKTYNIMVTQPHKKKRHCTNTTTQHTMHHAANTTTQHAIVVTQPYNT